MQFLVETPVIPCKQGVTNKSLQSQKEEGKGENRISRPSTFGAARARYGTLRGWLRLGDCSVKRDN